MGSSSAGSEPAVFVGKRKVNTAAIRRRAVMLIGDSRVTAERVGAEIGIEELLVDRGHLRVDLRGFGGCGRSSPDESRRSRGSV